MKKIENKMFLEKVNNTDLCELINGGVEQNMKLFGRHYYF